MIAFLGNRFHLRHTKSADFFIEFLRQEFGEVVVIPHKEAWNYLPRRHWDLVVAWQKLYPRQELEAFGADRVVLVPMYDDCPKEEVFWRQFRGFKAFCFSSTLERLLASFGLLAWGRRYYPALSNRAAIFGAATGLKGFFWPRSKSLGWELVTKLINGTAFSHMHVHWTPDAHPDVPRPLTGPEISSSSITVSTWFSNRKEYLENVSKANVFFAPRLAEGIGMSFLEAMSMGHCVVAACRPTMNEYINDGENGLLFNPEAPVPLDFSRAKELGEAARISCVKGRQAWQQSRQAIRAFFDSPSPGYRPRLHPAIQLRGRSIAVARRVYRFLRRRGAEYSS